MQYLLIVIVLQNGFQDRIDSFYKSKKACLEARTEALKHNNDLTKVKAKCKLIKGKK